MRVSRRGRVQNCRDMARIEARSGAVNVPRPERVKKARFPLVEALRVQRVAQVEVGAVQARRPGRTPPRRAGPQAAAADTTWDAQADGTRRPSSAAMYRSRAAPPNLCYRRAVIPAALLLDLVRGLTASTPPPRGLPYLGLEHASGTGFHLLDALSARGIFRKYELVLDVGAGLGGRARWLATRFGCEVVGATLTVEEAAGGTQLGRRSGLRAQVRLLPAAPQALPFRAARFTHVW